MRLHPRRTDQRPEFLDHPSVRALLAAETPTRCPRQAIRKRTRAFVQNLLASGWDGPPFDVELAASLRGYRVQEVGDFGEDRDGCISPGHPPRILVNASLPRVRKRFTIAHEIVHTLFPDFDRNSGITAWKYGTEGQSPVEQLCQLGAAELLMPWPCFVGVLGADGASLVAAREAARQFDVSLEAAARQVTTLSPRDLILVVLHHKNKPSEGVQADQAFLPGFESAPPPKRLRVHLAVTSDSCEAIFVPPDKSIPDSSIAYQVWERGPIGTFEESYASAEEDWSEISSKLGCVRIEAAVLRANSSSPASVLCILQKLGAHTKLG